MPYESYNAYLSVNNKTNKSKNYSQTKMGLLSSFKDSLSYFQVAIDNDNSVDCWIVDDSDVKDQKKILSPLYELRNGDIVTWQSEKWINVLTDNMSDLYYRGTLKVCVGSLVWQDVYGSIHEYDFTFKSDTPTNFGTSDGRILTIGNERRTVLIKNDEQSSLLVKGQRFIFDKRAWAITSLDSLSVKGLMSITLEESQIDTSKDNLELRVADYKEPNYEIILDKTSISLHVGRTIPLGITIRNNGVTLPSPTLSFTSSDNSICEVDADGNLTSIAEGTAIVTVKFQGQSITLNVTVSNSNLETKYALLINGDGFIVRGTSKTFACEFKQILDTNYYLTINNMRISSEQILNGVMISPNMKLSVVESSEESSNISGQSATFSITGLDNSSTTYASLISQANNTCVIKGNSVGYVLLHVVSNDGSLSAEKKIWIKSAI
ncbi:hypothetical protein F4V43_02540 [Paenibacillus spiritus]|uniref:BIG2 domain-containing protein n=1 Tax=Paenibacillus spiritus TaxID=2496557 RepID=A0A5J5GGW4_9BACL|nr:hypothetical protein [Paenibacillus spiritus]KAA9007385.1 hypothetical protein F4V43_02540 [Paenibacillus spiritus]